MFRFLAIHPFADGNGRLGRGLFLLSLLQSPNAPWSFIGRFLAIDRQIERHKEEYYFVLNQCSKGRFSSDPRTYRLDGFLSFMMTVLWESPEDIDVYRRRYASLKDPSPAETAVLLCFREQPELRLQSKDLVQKTAMPRRTVVRALSRLVDQGFLQQRGRGAGVRYQLVF